ncbi:MAG: DUF721 domain-containing protein [Desulfobacterota bacterium]|nr:DUF721 domain-containing protein [Thermodesulfobacteriota bacterium]
MTTTKYIPSLHDVLSSLFRDLNIEDKMTYRGILPIWRKVVGEQIACNAYPAAVRGNILFVNVANSVWMQQLAFMKKEILDKLNTALGSAARLTDIRFKIGPLPHSADTSPDGLLSQLSSQELQQIEHQTASIADPELREIFQRVVAAHLRNKKK